MCSTTGFALVLIAQEDDLKMDIYGPLYKRATSSGGLLSLENKIPIKQCESLPMFPVVLFLSFVHVFCFRSDAEDASGFAANCCRVCQVQIFAARSARVNVLGSLACPLLQLFAACGGTVLDL
jgi:hypothetical protein